VKRPISDLRRRLKQAQATQLDRMFEEMRRVTLSAFIEAEYRSLAQEGTSWVALADLTDSNHP
jgi:hypothetical protein